MPQKIKVAKVKLTATYKFTCPSCGYEIETLNGDTDWKGEDIAEAIDHFSGEGAPEGCVICNFCDDVIRLK
jgi:hypothetical protein